MKKITKIMGISLIVANSLFAYTDAEIDAKDSVVYNDAVNLINSNYANTVTLISNVDYNSTTRIDALDLKIGTMGTFAQAQYYADTQDATTLQNSKVYADNLNYDTLLYVNSESASTSARITSVYDSLNTQINTQTSMIKNGTNIETGLDTISFTKASAVTGNEHGLYITDTSTTISGGTTSSQLILNDNGANFSEVGSGKAIKVTGVATGTADTDVANTKQVNDAKNEAISEAQIYADSVGVTTLNSAKTYTDTKFASFTGSGISEAKVDEKIEASEKRSMDYTDSRISALEDSLTKEYRSATATAIALGVSPILSNGNKNALGIGLGYYEGENAVAINYVAEIDKNVHLQLGASLNAKSQGFKAGMSFGF